MNFEKRKNIIDTFMHIHSTQFTVSTASLIFTFPDCDISIGQDNDIIA